METECIACIVIHLLMKSKICFVESLWWIKDVIEVYNVKYWFIKNDFGLFNVENFEIVIWELKLRLLNCNTCTLVLCTQTINVHNWCTILKWK